MLDAADEVPPARQGSAGAITGPAGPPLPGLLGLLLKRSSFGDPETKLRALVRPTTFHLVKHCGQMLILLLVSLSQREHLLGSLWVRVMDSRDRLRQIINFAPQVINDPPDVTRSGLMISSRRRHALAVRGFRTVPSFLLLLPRAFGAVLVFK